MLFSIDVNNTAIDYMKTGSFCLCNLCHIKFSRFYFEEKTTLYSGLSVITYFNLTPVRHMTQWGAGSRGSSQLIGHREVLLFPLKNIFQRQCEEVDPSIDSMWTCRQASPWDHEACLSGHPCDSSCPMLTSQFIYDSSATLVVKRTQ